MFEAKEKTTGRIIKVYAVDGGNFLINRCGVFKWESYESFSPADGENCAPACDCILTVAAAKRMDLSELIAGIRSGDIEFAVGSTITTRLKSGKDVDFVVTDMDEAAYRFESRDCLGAYIPMTKIEKFMRETWDDLPDALRDVIMDTERYFKDGHGEEQSETRKLFLPAASEIFPPDECYGDEGLYTQMDWYKDLHNRVRAFEKGGKADWYWTQSRYSGYTTYWCYVTSNGYANSYTASSTYIAAPVCFRTPRFHNPRP